MAQIKNTGTLKEIQEAGNLQTGFDQIPTEASKAVVYTMEVNPKMMRRSNFAKSGTISDATSATLYTAPSNKDFYITSGSIGISGDATGAATNATLTCVLNGLTSTFLQVQKISGAASGNNALSFPFPIKVDRGSIIGITCNNATAAIRVNATITGYTVENQGA